MLNRILQNQWCRFVAGNLSVGILVVGIPVAVLLTIMNTLTVPAAGLLVLAIVHLALVGLQISRQGTWIPEKWLAAGYVFLPPIDVIFTVRWFSQTAWFAGFGALVLAVIASFFTIWIAKNQWRKWKHPKSATVTISRPVHEDHAANQPADDPTTMVY